MYSSRQKFKRTLPNTLIKDTRNKVTVAVSIWTVRTERIEKMGRKLELVKNIEAISKYILMHILKTR